MRRARELTFRGGDSKQDEPNWRGVKGQFTAEAQRTQRLRSEDEREWKREKKRFPVISLHLLGVLGAAAVNLTLLLLRYPTRTNRPVAIFVFAILTFSPCAFAQFRPLGEQNAEGGARANQLPLSGRSGQTGTVTTTQTPTPGTTTSVNTINPTIQTQGPFGGRRGAGPVLGQAFPA
jgi:hypothetical protein